MYEIFKNDWWLTDWWSSFKCKRLMSSMVFMAPYYHLQIVAWSPLIPREERSWTTRLKQCFHWKKICFLLIHSQFRNNSDNTKPCLLNSGLRMVLNICQMDWKYSQQMASNCRTYNLDAGRQLKVEDMHHSSHSKILFMRVLSLIS